MAKALVRPDLHLPFDVLSDISAQITLDLQVGVNPAPESDDLFVSQITDSRVDPDPGRLANLLGGRPTDAVDVGKGDGQSLFAMEVHTGDTSHIRYP